MIEIRCTKEPIAHFYLKVADLKVFCYPVGRPDTRFWQEKVEDIDTPCIALHKVKRLATKMCSLLDTLWFTRKDCRILAQLVNKCKENPKVLGEEDAAPHTQRRYWHSRKLELPFWEKKDKITP